MLTNWVQKGSTQSGNLEHKQYSSQEPDGSGTLHAIILQEEEEVTLKQWLKPNTKSSTGFVSIGESAVSLQFVSAIAMAGPNTDNHRTEYTAEANRNIDVEEISCEVDESGMLS